MRTFALFATLLVAIVAPMKSARAQAEFGWHACPYVFDAALTATLRRFKLKMPQQEFEGLGELLCQGTKIYQDLQTKRPQGAPLSRHTAESYFCKDPLYASYCRDGAAK